MNEKPHTRKQQKSLHLWLRKVTECLHKNGWYLEVNGLKIPPSEPLSKEIFRAGYSGATGKESTTDANTTDYDYGYQAMIKFFGDQGIELPPWPDLWSQSMEFKQQLYGNKK